MAGVVVAPVGGPVGFHQGGHGAPLWRQGGQPEQHHPEIIFRGMVGAGTKAFLIQEGAKELPAGGGS